LTGPILTVAIAANSVSDVLSSCSQPGMHALSVAGSLSFSQTVCGGTGSSYSPFMVIAIVRAPCAGLTNYSLVSHPIAYRLAQRLKRVLGRRLHEHWEDRMPEVKTEITAPTLVIAGRHDPATTREANEYIRQHIPGAKLTVLETAHIANVEQPQLYADTVLKFLLN